ncbi:MAG: RNA methyltransferase [Nitrospirae bacterium]|nr:RNA methyltransferase [Nitrospirota bacterium]
MPPPRKEITSASNPLVKEVVRLHKPENRDGAWRILLEGPHVIGAALESSRARIEKLFIAPGAEADVEIAGISCRAEADIVEVSDAVMRKIATTGTPQGVAAVAVIEFPALEAMELAPDALVVVADGIQDPGNLGGLVRTAEAAGASAVIILDGSADPLGPKAVRSSAGSVFFIPVARAAPEEFIAWAKSRGMRIVGADGHAGGASVWDISADGPVALLFGSEGMGLRQPVRGALDEAVSIPVFGRAESLNVTAAAVVIYEIVRKRSQQGASAPC